MASYNRVILLGHMTRDPELRQTNSSVVANFGMAANRKFKGQDGEEREEVLFVDCAAWGKLGEVVNQYCQKGKQLLIEGRLQFDQWEDQQTGAKRSKLSIVVESLQMLSDAGGQGGQSGGGGYEQRPPASQRAAQGRATHDQQRRQQPASNQQRTSKGSQGQGYNVRPGKAPQNAAQGAAQPSGGFNPDDDLQFREDDIPF